MPTFSDDKSYEKFKKETEAFSSSSKISGVEKNNSLFRKVFSESSSDINMYIIHIYVIFIHFRSCPVKNCLC